MRTVTGVTLVVTLSCALPALAQPRQIEPEKTAKIAGLVLNAATNEPLRRANIFLSPAEPQPNSSASSTTTDASGRFAMDSVPPGRYRLRAEKTGFVATEFGARGASRVGTALTLLPGQELKQLEVKLQPHAVIAGRVTDEEGEAVANVRVQSMVFRYMQGSRQLVPSGVSTTNDLGEYRIFGLPPGRYYLSAAINNSPMLWNAVDRTAGGRPDQGDESYTATYYPGTSDISGAMAIPVPAGRQVTNLDMKLLRTPTVRVRGRVLGLETSRTGVMLMPREMMGRWGFGQRPAMTAPDGTFEIRGVAPGSYFLSAQAAERGERRSARLAIDVGNTTVEGIELSLAPGQQITGMIKFEGERPPELHVQLESVEFTPWGQGAGGRVNEDGSFSLSHVEAGTYRLRAFGAQGQAYVKAVYSGDQQVTEAEINVTQGAPLTLRVVLGAAEGQVSGEVRDPQGTPVNGAIVVLAPEPARRTQSSLFKMATADQYGRFSVKGVPPGEYKLFAWDFVEPGEWLDPEFLKQFESKGKTVSIGEHSQLAADLELLKNELSALQ